MIREFFEETGLTLLDPKLCGIKQFFVNETRYIVLLYRATKFSGDLRSSSEGEIFWLPERDLLKHDTLSEIYQVQDNINLY